MNERKVKWHNSERMDRYKEGPTTIKEIRISKEEREVLKLIQTKTCVVMGHSKINLIFKVTNVISMAMFIINANIISNTT